MNARLAQSARRASGVEGMGQRPAVRTARAGLAASVEADVDLLQLAAGRLNHDRLLAAGGGHAQRDGEPGADGAGLDGAGEGSNLKTALIPA